MKHSKLCAKCGSDKVLMVGGGLNRGQRQLPLGSIDWVRVDRWVCCSCGYSEEWVDETELDRVEQYWSTRQK